MHPEAALDREHARLDEEYQISNTNPKPAKSPPPRKRHHPGRPVLTDTGLNKMVLSRPERDIGRY